MTFLRQSRPILKALGLSVFFAVTFALSVASSGSWAAPSFNPQIDRLQPQLVAMDSAKTMVKTVEKKTSSAFGSGISAPISNSMSGPSTPVAGKSKRFQSDTQAAINNSVENPGYLPGGRSKQADQQSRDTVNGAESKIRDAFK